MIKYIIYVFVLSNLFIYVSKLFPNIKGSNFNLSSTIFNLSDSFNKIIEYRYEHGLKSKRNDLEDKYYANFGLRQA